MKEANDIGSEDCFARAEEVVGAASASPVFTTSDSDEVLNEASDVKNAFSFGGTIATERERKSEGG